MLYPVAFVPSFLVEVQNGYIADYGDPLVSGMYGLYGEAYKTQISWFSTFVYCEAYVRSVIYNFQVLFSHRTTSFIQLPLFVYALYALYYNLRSSYPIIALYGAHAATSILPCIVHFLQTPVPCTTKHLVSAIPCFAPHQQRALLGIYGVFLVITVLITVDMGLRSKNWIERSVNAERAKAE